MTKKKKNHNELNLPQSRNTSPGIQGNKIIAAKTTHGSNSKIRLKKNIYKNLKFTWTYGVKFQDSEQSIQMGYTPCFRTDIP